MKDSNGIDMETGMIVKISNAFHKNDNGLYYVDHSPGDPNWCGNDHSMKKICKNGKISKSRQICFWPITSFVNDRSVRARANDWNAKNAIIEVVNGITHEHIAAEFRAKAMGMDGLIEHDSWNFGTDSNVYAQDLEIKEFYQNVADRLSA